MMTTGRFVVVAVFGFFVGLMPAWPQAGQGLIRGQVIDPAGNQLAPADHVNNVEGVSIAQPLSGTYTMNVVASRLGQGPRQSYALVVAGDIADAPPQPPLRTRAARH